MAYGLTHFKKLFIGSASFSFFCLCSCKKGKEPVEQNNPVVPPVVNLAPGPFTISPAASSWDSIAVTWTKPVDPENDTISYRIYLNDTLKADNHTVTAYSFKNLRELTLYKIKIVAIDTKKNETASLFETTTLKYWLRFLKKVQYGPITGYSYQKTGDMIKTSDGGYIIVGDSQLGDWPDGPISMFSLKIDSLGNKLWQKRYNYTVGNSTEIRIQQHTNGGYIICGGNNLMKITNEGDLVWHKKGDYMLEETFNGIAINQDGTIYTVGHAASDSSNNVVEALLSKYDANGHVIWRNRYSPTTREQFYDIKRIANNELLVAGTTSEPNADFWVLKLRGDGSIIWDKQYYGQGYAFPKHIIQTKEGKIVLTGYHLGTYSRTFLYVQMLDESGNHLWAYPFHTNASRGYYVSETNDNSLVVTGGNQLTYTAEAALFKFDKTGNLIWEKYYQEFATYLFNKTVIPTADGGYIINSQKSKAYNTSPETNEIYLFKTDDKGSF